MSHLTKSDFVFTNYSSLATGTLVNNNNFSALSGLSTLPTVSYNSSYLSSYDTQFSPNHASVDKLKYLSHDQLKNEVIRLETLYREVTVEKELLRTKLNDQTKKSEEYNLFYKARVKDFKNLLATLKEENENWKAKYSKLEIEIIEKTKLIELQIEKELNLKDKVDNLEKQLDLEALKLEEVQSNYIRITQENDNLIQTQQKYAQEMTRIGQILIIKMQELEVSKGENKSLQSFLTEKFSEIQYISSKLTDTEGKLVEVMEERANIAASLSQKTIKKKTSPKAEDSSKGKVKKDESEVKSRFCFSMAAASPKRNKTPMNKKGVTPKGMKDTQGFSSMADSFLRESMKSSRNISSGKATPLAKKIAEKNLKDSAPKIIESRIQDPEEEDERLARILAEKEKLDFLLTEKTAENLTLKKKIEEYAKQEKEYQSQIAEKKIMNSVLLDRIKEVEVMLMRLRGMEAEITQVIEQTKTIARNATESEKINKELNLRLSTIEDWKAKLAAFDNFCAELKTVETFNPHVIKEVSTREEETEVNNSIVLARAEDPDLLEEEPLIPMIEQENLSRLFCNMEHKTIVSSMDCLEVEAQ